MDNRKLVQGFLDELGHRTGNSDVSMDENGIVAFSYGDEAEIVIEVPDQSEAVYFYSPIKDLHHIEQSELFELYERLLQLNLLCMETRGATFSLDKNNMNIVICFVQSIKDLDAEDFINLLGNFTENVVELKKEHFSN